MSVTLVHHRFSVDEYEAMIRRGILSEDDRVELIRGEIIEKMPIGDEHSASVKKLNRILSGLVGDRAIVSVQDPIRLEDSEPEPDIALLRPRSDFYASGKPQASDVLLLIEVADTSLEFDRTVKRPLYAQAGIQELWIVNLADRSVEIYRQPKPTGEFQFVRILTPGQRADVQAIPGLAIDVDAIV